MSTSEDQFLQIVKSQMGVDPKDLDPVTLDLFRQKFLGSEAKGKKEKQRKSKRANKVDLVEEDERAQKTRGEGDIHLHSYKRLKQEGGEKVVSQQLDFADIFRQIETSKAADPSEPQVNTTKLKKQLKVVRKDPSKTLSVPLSGAKKLKAMRD